jgi:hypothetical protein
VSSDQAAVRIAHAFKERRPSERKESARRIAGALYRTVIAAQAVGVPVEDVIAEELLSFADAVLEVERSYIRRDAKAALTGAIDSFQRAMRAPLEEARRYAESLLDK